MPTTARCLLPFAMLILPVLALTVASAAEGPKEAARPAVPEAVTLIADLRAPPANAFCHGSWEGRAATTASGLLIQGHRGADGSGEFGESFEAPRDLSKAKFIELALGVGAKNGVPEVTVAFDDTDETQYTARIRIDQIVPDQPVWLRVRREDFRLNNWQGNKTSAAIDWTRIVRWHLQGDWSKAVPFQVIFIALRYRP